MNSIPETCNANEFIEIDYCDESTLESKPTVACLHEVPDDNVDIDVEGSDSASVDTDAEDSDYLPDDVDIEGFDKLDEKIKSHKKSRTQSVRKTNQGNIKIKEISCKVCFKKFKYLKCLKRHLLSHSDKKYRKCDKCPNEIFLTLNELNEHKRTCHKIVKVRGKPRARLPKVNHTCNVCSKHFKTKSDLRCHLVIHTGDTPFKCNDCGKVFPRKGDLTRHINTVCSVKLGWKSKKYHCNTCKKSYSRLDKLKRHLLIHTGDMPYKCDHCDRTFNRSETLRKHEKGRRDTDSCLPHFSRINQSRKSKHQCKICGNYYAHKGYLKVHMHIHTEEKPYKCANCTLCFSRKDLLMIHIKKIHFSKLWK